MPSTGDEEQPDRAGPLFRMLDYDELRAIAGRIARGGRVPEREATSLLHEALANWMQRGDGKAPVDREAAIARMVMTIRNASIDRARRQARASSPTAVDPGLLDKVPAEQGTDIHREDLERIAATLDELRARAPRQAMAMELRFHGGLSLEQVAGAIGISLAQAKRDIAAAKAFVRSRLSGEEGSR